MSKSKINFVAFLIILNFPMMLFFQNCGGSQFKVPDSFSSMSELSEPSSEGTHPEEEPTPSTTDPTSTAFSLYVAKAGDGDVTSAPEGISCGSDCSGSFQKEASVVLTAVAAAGYVFKGWNGDCSGAGATCTVKMTAAKNVSVSFESANAQESVDVIIAQMPTNSWKALPNTLMKDVCPLPYNSYACEAVILAWGGGAYDLERDRMVIMGGGHGDSWYNNVFAFDLGTMKWLRLSEMPPGSGNKPPEYWKDIRIEPCGYYPKGPLTIPADAMIPGKAYVDPAKCFVEPIVSQLDFQQPRSTHSYNKVYVDSVNSRYCYIPIATYPSAQTGTSIMPCFNIKTGLWERLPDRPDSVGRAQTALAINGNIWFMSDNNGIIAELDMRTNLWTTYGRVNLLNSVGGDIDRKRGVFYTLYNETTETRGIYTNDLNSPASLRASPSYAIVKTTGDVAVVADGLKPGFVYADSIDKFVTWSGGRSLKFLDPMTHVWKKVTGTGDDPGPQSKWGTFGRFRYSTKRGVFVVVNATTQNVFIYKP